MKWFKHFSNSHNNNKLTKVRMRYGADGYAIYWYCLELIASDLGESKQITFELCHDAEVIGHNLKIDQIRVEEIMRYMVDIGLFDEASGTITCLKLAKYLDKKTTRNKTIHAIIDAANSVPDCPRQSLDSPPTVPQQSPDCPGMSPLDTDTDTDTEKEKRKNTTKEIFTLPSWIPSDVWDEWMTCRKKLKAQNTPRAMTILVKKLEQCRESGIEAKDAMETAIVRGWKSVEVDWLRRGQTPPEQKRASGREFPA